MFSSEALTDRAAYGELFHGSGRVGHVIGGAAKGSHWFFPHLTCAAQGVAVLGGSLLAHAVARGRGIATWWWLGVVTAAMTALFLLQLCLPRCHVDW